MLVQDISLPSVRSIWKITFLVSIVIGLSFSAFQIYWNSVEFSRTTTKTLNAVVSASTTPAARAVEFLDKDLAKELVSGLNGTDLFSSVKIVDDFGREMASKTKPVSSGNTTDWIASLTGTKIHYEVSVPLSTKSSGDGKMLLTVDLSPQFAALTSKNIADILIPISIISLVAVFSSFFGFRRIDRGFAELLNWAERNASQSPSPIPETSKFHYSEIATVAEILSGLSSAQNETMRELEQQEKLRSDQLRSIGNILKSTDQALSYFDEDGQLTFTSVDQNAAAAISDAMREPLFDLEAARDFFEKYDGSLRVLHDARTNQNVTDLIYVLEVETEAEGIWMVQAVRQNNRTNSLVCSNVTDLRRKERNFQHAQKMEALGSLTSGVAHEFNNMLAIISGNLEILALDAGLQKKQLRRLEAAAMASDRAASVVERLQVYSHKTDVHPEVLDLAGQLSELEKMLSNTLGPHIKLRVKSQENQTVCVDPNLLDAALVNLATNARDAMPDGGNLIISARSATADEISLTELPPDLSCAVIEVEDSGSGISADDREKIFDPFFTTKSLGDGVGLGLSYVYGFAHKSKGTVWCGSKEGEGAIFRLFLPHSKQAPIQPSQGECKHTAGLVEKHCLVVDDEAGIIDILNDMLTFHGMKVQSATSLAQARKLLLGQKSQFDFVICDLRLKDGSCEKLLKTFKQTHPETLVVLMSGYIDDAQRDSLQVDHIIGKPINLDHLVTVLSA